MNKLLRLQNFKCFEDLVLELRPLTLLTGLNGAGKSSVLQSLLLLRQSFQTGRLTIVGLSLNGELTNIGTGKEALFEDAKNDVIAFELASGDMEGALSGKWSFQCDQSADVLESIPIPRSVIPNIYSASLFTDDFQYLRAERVGPRLYYPMSSFLVGRHRQISATGEGEYTSHFLLEYGEETIPNGGLGHAKAASLTLLPQVEAWLGEISPGTRISLTPDLNTNTIRLDYSFVMGTHVSNNYHSTNVGFGITYVLPILVAILSANPDSLLLIENPEAHLHPKGQAKMGELLALAAASGVQLIVETHSDHVLNGMRVAVHDGKLDPHDVQVHFFSRREQDGQTQVVSPQINRDGRFDQWPDDFFDQWENSLDALMQPRKE